MAPNTREILPAPKKNARTSFWLVFVFGSGCIVITDVVTILKYFLFAQKKHSLFAKFVKNTGLKVKCCFYLYQFGCCRE